MPTPGATPAYIGQQLQRICGYSSSLIETQYEFAKNEIVNLAAFAHRPFDARTACIAVIQCDSPDPRPDVLQRRKFGAPVVFVCWRSSMQVWRPSSLGAECIETGLTPTQIQPYLEQHRADLAPQRLYEAKTLGRLPGSGRQLQLFVDPELLRFAEEELGSPLTELVIEIVGLLSDSFGSGQLTVGQKKWVSKSTFRLLAGKILKDKLVPGFLTANFSKLDNLFQRVQHHYGSEEPVELGKAPQQNALAEASEMVLSFGSLKNLTTETLAFIYERALVTDETRRLFGTHGTPSYLADYVVWRLSEWIQELDPVNLQVFEPACGHAPFLVSMVRLLRSASFGMTAEELSEFMRKRFVAIDKDDFALELARLSLTVADVPNRNGWGSLKSGDMLSGDFTKTTAQQSSVLFTNPPFEGSKALRTLDLTLPNLPEGAVFGLILPTTLLFSDKRRPALIRKCLRDACQLNEITLFPDQIFEFADQECATVLGRKSKLVKRFPVTTNLGRVREGGRLAFRQRYDLTTFRRCQQSELKQGRKDALWIPEWSEEIWRWLEVYDQLRSVVTANKGVEFKGKKDRPAGAKTTDKKYFPRGVKGFVSSTGNWQIHDHPPLVYMNLSKNVIRRWGAGSERGTPQVLVNYAPARRNAWRLKPFIDRIGRPLTSRLIAVRPRSGRKTPLEYLWAICCSPLANFFIYTHTLKREVRLGSLGELPVPRASRREISRVVNAARAYRRAAAHSGDPHLFETPGARVSTEQLHALLRRMDAEVLRLYDLPARAECELLRQFSGLDRPGVPGRFSTYYAEGFSQCVPLYAYLSDAYQRHLQSDNPELDDEDAERFDELMLAKEGNTLTKKEADELHWLQAEVDGRDYALNPPDNSWLEEIERAQQNRSVELGTISSAMLGLSSVAEVTNEN